MSIRFKNTNGRTPTKEEIKLHIIEKRFCNYDNSELRDAMVNGTFKKIYNEIIDRVFN